MRPTAMSCPLQVAYVGPVVVGASRPADQHGLTPQQPRGIALADVEHGKLGERSFNRQQQMECSPIPVFGRSVEWSGTMPERFDLVVIGAGGAGSTVAFDAVNRDVKVAMIERWKVGGTCLNVGCDPTKTLVRAAAVAHTARHAARYGIEIPEFTVDWPAVMDRVARVIDTIRGGDGDANVRNAGISLFKSHARFRDANTLMLEDGQIIYADRVVVATGASERTPTIDGLQEVGYITNMEAVALAGTAPLPGDHRRRRDRGRVRPDLRPLWRRGHDPRLQRPSSAKGGASAGRCFASRARARRRPG